MFQLPLVQLYSLVTRQRLVTPTLVPPPRKIHVCTRSSEDFGTVWEFVGRASHGNVSRQSLGTRCKDNVRSNSENLS
jgi:hypothetical protein